MGLVQAVVAAALRVMPGCQACQAAHMPSRQVTVRVMHMMYRQARSSTKSSQVGLSVKLGRWNKGWDTARPPQALDG